MTEPRRPKESFQLLSAMLEWSGVLCNRQVADALGVQPVRASNLIRDFREGVECDLAYNPSTKCWELKGDTDTLPVSRFADFHALGMIPTADISDQSSYSTPRNIANVRGVVRAIFEKRYLQFTYRTLQLPKGEKRHVIPCKVILASGRIHARGWCMQRKSFRDFNTGRMSEIVLGRSSPSIPEDPQWNDETSVTIVAHRALSTDQKRLIQDEHFNGENSRSYRVKQALLPYFLQDIRATTKPDRERPPQYLLEAQNPETLSHLLFPRG